MLFVSRRLQLCKEWHIELVEDAAESIGSTYKGQHTGTFGRIGAISFNGKARFSMELPADMPREEIEKAALAHENSAKWMEGKTPKKIIVVPGKIVNIVI